MSKPPYLKTKESESTTTPDSNKESKLTFTPHLKKKFASAHIGNLYIRVTKDRKSEYHSIGVSLNERYWNEKRKEVRESYSDADELNKKISDKLEQVKKEKQANIKKIPFQNKLSFLEYLSSEITHLLSRQKFGSYKRYKTTFYHIEKYIKAKQKTDLLFTDIDINFVRDFESYLLAHVKENTTKNYINCIRKLYKQAVNSDLVVMNKDPFTFYKNSKSEVDKKFLTKIDIEKILTKQFEHTNPLFHTRNYFLFQYFAQGLRVRDLLTLRWHNLVDGKGEFKIIQTKTRKPHTVFLNENLVFILKDYIPQNLVLPILNHTFNLKIEDSSGVTNYKNITYQKMKTLFSEYKKTRPLSGTKIQNKEVDEFSNALTDRRNKLTTTLSVQYYNYAKKHLNEFILPILSNEDFSDVVFDENTKLSKQQYNQCEAKVAMYNKRLKQLQTACDISTKLTTHLSRHSFANNLLESGADIYDVSKLIGHSHLGTTEFYLESFKKQKVLKPSENFNSEYSFQMNVEIITD